MLEEVKADTKAKGGDDVSIKDAGVVSIEKGCIEEVETGRLDATELWLRENNISHAYVQELLSDKKAVRRLVRKVDLVVLPLLAGTYLLQSVFDLFHDTNITQTQYAWMPSIFYLAYLVAEYPWSFLAQRTRMAKVIAGCVMSWGVVLILTAACSSFGGLMACRFFLGVFESAITPLFIMIIGMWYTRDEQPFRAGIFYSCNGMGGMVGGILSYALGQIKGFPVWKAIFLLCGGMTVIWGILLLWLLPDSIIRAKKFTTEEKAILIGRGRLGRTGILNQSIKLSQIKEAILDPQVQLLGLFVLLNEIINGGVANFGKLIIKGLVKDPLRATAFGIPSGAFQFMFVLSGTYMASRFRNTRTIMMAIYVCPTIVGTTLMWKLERSTWNNKVGVLIGYYVTGSFVASLVIAMQMTATNLGGYTKRMTATAIVFAAYCIGNIIGPHAFLAEESPTYPTGCRLILGCSVSQIGVSLGLRLLLIRRNKKRDQVMADAGTVQQAIDESVDLTDFEASHDSQVLR